MSARPLIIAALAALLLYPAAATAQQVLHSGVGPRVGFSTDPDQFVFGGQLTIGEIAPHVTFDPSLEVGFGDNLTSIAANFDLHYHFPLTGYAWTPYAGAGATIVNYSYDNDLPNGDSNNTEAGGSLLDSDAHS